MPGPAAVTGPAAETGPAALAGLPRLLVLTDRSACRRPLPEVVAAAVEGGARAVVLRERDLAGPERGRLAAELGALLAPVDGLLVLAGVAPPASDGSPATGRPPATDGPPAAGGPPAADGPQAAGLRSAVHLAARDALPRPRPALLGRSCHDAVEVASAAAERCDWVTASPVHPTASKPGYGPPLGTDGLAALVAVPGAPPVFALGGVTARNAAACCAAGAHGVAVMGEVMRAADPARCVAELLAQLAASGGAA